MTLQYSYYVSITAHGLKRLRDDVKTRFWNYPPIDIYKVERNHVIRYDSINMAVRDGMSMSQYEAITNFIQGWISGANLPSSFNHEQI